MAKKSYLVKFQLVSPIISYIFKIKFGGFFMSYFDYFGIGHEGKIYFLNKIIENNIWMILIIVEEERNGKI